MIICENRTNYSIVNKSGIWDLGIVSGCLWQEEKAVIKIHFFLVQCRSLFLPLPLSPMCGSSGGLANGMWAEMARGTYRRRLLRRKHTLFVSFFPTFRVDEHFWVGFGKHVLETGITLSGELVWEKSWQLTGNIHLYLLSGETNSLHVKLLRWLGFLFLGNQVWC